MESEGRQPRPCETSRVAVPMYDLRAQYLSMRADIDQTVRGVLEGGEFERGEVLDTFAAVFARFCGVKCAVPVGSGHAALFLTLKAAGIGPGDEVISVANTDMATIAAISHTGALPVWVDIDPHTYNIDPCQIEERITPHSRAIVPVHLYGLPADMDSVLEIAQRHSLLVVEDAALAIGARHRGCPVGGLGDAGCFSFAPNKILGAYGDGGMVTTNDLELADRIRLWGSYGETRRYDQIGAVKIPLSLDHEVPGYHSHLDSLQAAVLGAKMKYLDDWITRRQALAALYDRQISGLGLATPRVPPGLEHVYRNYVVRVRNRDRVRRSLARRGVETMVLYVPPVHLQTAYEHRGMRRGALPATEAAADELLCLPICPELSDEQVRYVAESLKQAIEIS